MVPTPKTGSVLGLALIVLAGTTAGFLAASLPSATGSPDVGPIAPGQARLVEPAPGEIDVRSPGEGAAQVLVYDEQARLLGSLYLPAGADGGSLELGTDQPAIVLVPKASDAVELGLSQDAEVRRVPTEASPRDLVVASGSVDEQVTLTIHERPASLGLRLDGEARGLEVDVRTSEGPALRQTNETTEPGHAGQAQLEPAHLTNGTYRVAIEADHLDGRLALVPRSLVHDEELATLEAPEALEPHGTLLASVHQGEAWQVPAHSVDELALAVEEGGWADVRLYSPDHRVLQRVEIGEQGPAWRWSSNGSEQPSYRPKTVDASLDAYTVYVDRVRANTDATVYVLDPEETGMEPGRAAELRTTTVTIAYPSPSGTEEESLRYAGGLVNVGVDQAQGAAAERSITVDSPLGVVLERQDQAAAGASISTDRAKHVERFGPGPLDITVEAEAASGSLQLEVEHYVP